MSWSCDLRRPSLCWPLKTLCWTLSGSWGCLEHKIPFFLAQLCSKPLSAPESACLGLTVRGAHEPALGNTWRFFWKGGWFQHNSHQELRLGSSGFTHHHPPLQSLRGKNKHHWQALWNPQTEKANHCCGNAFTTHHPIWKHRGCYAAWGCWPRNTHQAACEAMEPYTNACTFTGKCHLWRQNLIGVLTYHLLSLFSCLVVNSLRTCLTPCKPVHGIFQAKILEWITISSFRGSSQPRDQICVSSSAGRFFIRWVIREAPLLVSLGQIFLLFWTPVFPVRKWRSNTWLT